MFLNGDVRDMHVNSGLGKYRENIVGLVATINKIVKGNS